MIGREKALEMLRKYLKDDKTVKHCLAVEAIMKFLAKKLGEDVNLWGLIGLLHDIDYDLVNRDPKRHGLKALEILNGILPDKALDVIAAHNEHNGYKLKWKENERLLHALRASDHLSGLIIATALVMPNKKLSEVKFETLKRKFKSKDFARRISRGRIREIEYVGLSVDEFLKLGLEALKSIASDLGL